MVFKKYFAKVKKPLAEFFFVKVPKTTPLVLRLYPWVFFLVIALYICLVVDKRLKNVAKKILLKRKKKRRIIEGQIHSSNEGIDKCMCENIKPIKEYPVTPIQIRNGKKCRIGGMCGNIGGEYISCDLPSCSKWYDFNGQKEHIQPK